jgi:heat shock protein HslJ
VQHGTQSSSSTPVPKASNKKPNFAVITTAEWMVHDKVQRWMEEGPGEQPWNSMEASSIEVKDQGRNESGEQDTD